MSDAADSNVVHRGAQRTVRYARAANGSYPAKDFLESEVVPEKDKASLLRTMQLLSAVGKVTNPEKFKKLEGDLWEFKSYQTRIGAFQNGNSWYLTSGFVKKKDGWPKSELERADRIRLEQLEHLRNRSEL
ncbi:MAG: type II toxin-antitoxin system RelE/ParE family toxin [Planctomycetes bacterium]|nr:type II toxin-antitoxin system RelE/ParE family toxin [Planctomycetota bacterium]